MITCIIIKEKIAKNEKSWSYSFTWFVIRNIGTKHYEVYTPSIERIVECRRWSTFFWWKCKSRTVSHKCLIFSLFFYLMVPFYHHYRNFRYQRLHKPEYKYPMIAWARLLQCCLHKPERSLHLHASIFKIIFSLFLSQYNSKCNNSEHQESCRKRVKSCTFPSSPIGADRFHGWEFVKMSKSSNQTQFHLWDTC